MVFHDGGYPIEVPVAPVQIKNRISIIEAEKLFGQFWRFVTLKHQVWGESRCYCCSESATTESAANVWGTVVAFPTCDGCHDRYHGKLVDSVECG